MEDGRWAHFRIVRLKPGAAGAAGWREPLRSLVLTHDGRNLMTRIAHGLVVAAAAAAFACSGSDNNGMNTTDSTSTGVAGQP
jgi:hypothetical protein